MKISRFNYDNHGKKPPLSYLPEDIIHHILYSCLVLTNRELVQLSLVSKQFSSLLQKRLTLAFGYYKNQPRRPYSEEVATKYTEMHKEELNYVVSTLDRYCRENIQLESFSLRPDYLLLKRDVYPIYDSCIKLAAKTSLKKLTICTLENNHYKPYTIPQVIFQVKSLVELDFMGCYLKPMKRVVWPNLKNLKLLGCQVTEEGFEYISGGCPSIENMIIEAEAFIKSIFNVANLRNLKQLDITLDIDQRLEINASTSPNLESIACQAGHVDLGNAEYQNLTNLELFNCGGVDEHFFNNFAHKFPKLGNLCIGCDQIQRIDLSSPSLKKIKLVIHVATLEEACFNLPNLVCFTCFVNYIDRFPKLSFTGNLGGWKSHIICWCWGKGNIDSSWFLELNKLLAALNKSETSIKLNIFSKEGEGVVFNDQEHLNNVNPLIIPVQGIKEFIIWDAKHWSGFISSFASEILDCLLLICQPQTITFNRCKTYEIPELLYKKLTSGSLDHRGIVDFEISCWNGINYETSERSARFKDWNKFLEVLIKQHKNNSYWNKFLEVWIKTHENISFHLEYCSESVPNP